MWFLEISMVFALMLRGILRMHDSFLLIGEEIIMLSKSRGNFALNEWASSY
jgi:hypothetical protein